jgi:hypothetical protein
MKGCTSSRGMDAGIAPISYEGLRFFLTWFLPEILTV